LSLPWGFTYLKYKLQTPESGLSKMITQRATIDIVGFIYQAKVFEISWK
jgi:hypothetical protein